MSECQKCGTCCREMNSPPFAPAMRGRVDESWRLPHRLYHNYIEGLELFAGRPDGSPCFWLNKDNSCSEYEHRPEICCEHKPGTRDDCPAKAGPVAQSGE